MIPNITGWLPKNQIARIFSCPHITLHMLVVEDVEDVESTGDVEDVEVTENEDA